MLRMKTKYDLAAAEAVRTLNRFNPEILLDPVYVLQPRANKVRASVSLFPRTVGLTSTMVNQNFR
jgi:hypothetical protein